MESSLFETLREEAVARAIRRDQLQVIAAAVEEHVHAAGQRVLLEHSLTLQGNISLRFAEGWEPFIPMGGGETITVPKGELVYRDDAEVLTRNWVWRQCDKDKATEKTKNIFIPIDVLGEVGKERADEIIRELSELIPRYLGGTIFSGNLNREKTSIEFSF